MTQPMYQGASIAEPPTFAGPLGSAAAWRVRLAELGRRPTPDQDATVDCFIVRAPGCHVFWTHWMLSVIHLRPIAGVPPAVLRVDGATHELQILALNPEQPLPSVDATTPGWRIHFLTPIDVVEQFTAANEIVGGQINYRLCDSCAARPNFKRMTKRVPIARKAS